MRVTAAAAALLLAASCHSSRRTTTHLRPVQVGKGRALVETKYGWGVRFIDARGEVARGDQRFERAGAFSEGAASARLADRRYGFIHARGR